MSRGGAALVRSVSVVLARLLVQVLTRLRPQRWCPPSLSLRLFRLAFDSPAVPATARSVRTDLVYAPGRRGRFDLAVPDRKGPHPLVVWAHGGGWHFGDKRNVLPYAERLAARGFAVAVVNYPLAPRAQYPDALVAVNDAVAHLVAHAQDYDLDPDRVVLAGDSVGAQLAGELAAQVAAPRADAPVEAAISRDQLRGAALFCGIYDPRGLEESDRIFEAVLESAMWSMTRTRRWQAAPACASMTVVDHLTAAFPPTFLASGGQDPLHRRQTPVMAARLKELGVPLDEQLPGDEAQPCFHEYQFLLDTEAGAETFERLVSFLERVTSNSH